MRPRTCSRCHARMDACGVLTVQLHRTADGGILASPHHVCAVCLTRETADELDTQARQNRHATPDPCHSSLVTP